MGPELSTIGTSAPVDYLVESLLLPSSKIKENFHSVTVITDDGKAVTGIPEKETETELTIRLADDKVVSIAKNAIDERVLGGSLMPTDVVDTLSKQELLDLVRYLSELGKPGPFGATQELAARRWELYGPIPDENKNELTSQFVADSADPKGSSTGEKEGWRESLTTNDAWVYLREYALSPESKLMFASTVVDVSKGGKIRLTLQPGPKASFWLDGKELSIQQTGGEEGWVDVELDAGKHHLLARIDLTKVPHFLKLRAFGLSDGVDFKLAEP